MRTGTWEADTTKSAPIFLTEWLRSPLGVGAIAPSSRFLAQAMTEGLLKTDEPVLELGPGTGIFTSAILKCGVQPQLLAAVEIGEEFADSLTRDYPAIHVIRADAASVDKVTPFALGSVGAVICGLPLLSMPADKVRKIISGSFQCLKPDGEFRLFTYGHRCPVSKHVLDQLQLTAHRSNIVLRNLPPASVYVIRRQVA